MAKQVTRKAKPTVKRSFKELVEGHPLLVGLGSLSLLVNVVAGGWGLANILFGDRPILAETYLEITAYGIRTTPSDLLEEQKCTIVQNEIYKMYSSIPKPKFERLFNIVPPVKARSYYTNGDPLSSSDDVVFLVLRNAGGVLARNVEIDGRMMRSPKGHFPNGSSIANQRGSAKDAPTYDALLEDNGASLIDPNEMTSTISVGSIPASGCIAIPMALINGGPGFLSGYGELAKPVFIPTQATYSRPFGIWKEHLAFRKMLSIPQRLSEQIMVRG